jgi:hypothetical protein
MDALVLTTKVFLNVADAFVVLVLCYDVTVLASITPTDIKTGTDLTNSCCDVTASSDC